MYVTTEASMSLSRDFDRFIARSVEATRLSGRFALAGAVSCAALTAGRRAVVILRSTKAKL